MIEQIITIAVVGIVSFAFSKFVWPLIRIKIDTADEERLLLRAKRISIIARDFLNSKDYDGPIDNIAADLLDDFVKITGEKEDVAKRVLGSAARQIKKGN